MNDMSRPGAQDAILAYLNDPVAHGGRMVQRMETHGAVIFLAGDRAYKVKRAVKFPFLDFSTLDRRRRFCRAEVELNRRTAPDLYIGVGAVVARPDGTLALVEDGVPAGTTPLEWLVVMRRFDQEDLADRVAARGDLTIDLMRDLADGIASFHEEAEPRPDGDGADGVREIAEGILARLGAFPALFPTDRVDRLARLMRGFLAGHADLLDRRRDAGYVRHCHGDLHLRNIVLRGGRPVLFDCIEFDERFAVCDVLYDLAFLLMDLEHRRLRPLANVLFNRYLDQTCDLAGLALLPLFLAMRAGIRAHITATMAEGAEAPPDRTALEGEARSYLDLALSLAQPEGVRLIAIGGLSGTGKTTLARWLAPETGPAPGAVILRSDVLRKRMLGLDDGVRLSDECYSETVTARVYAEMAGRAGLALDSRHAVICDGVYARPEQRAAIEDIAGTAQIPFSGLWLVADQQVQLERVGERVGDASDATADIVRRQSRFDIGDMRWDILSANGTPEEVAGTARRLISTTRG
ncbi:MAG: hypothetical protein RLY86_1597 [Pseudomonadota bacterium]|jgi:aminoglycoside phosphotransferase family enzyme/predicted kinase